jgi:hypothetical protein
MKTESEIMISIDATEINKIIGDAVRKKVLETLLPLVEAHREHAKITCPEKCFCHDVSEYLSALEMSGTTRLANDPASAALQPAESRGQSLEQPNNPGAKSPGI